MLRKGSATGGRPLRAGIVGAGWVAGARHAPVYRARRDTDLVAVYDRKRARAERLAGDVDVDCYTDSWDEFVAQDLDIISICTPPFAHEQYAVPALQAGMHVLLEKPMAMDAASAGRIAAAATAHERLLCVSHNFLFSRSMQRLRREIESGEAGAIRFVMGMQASSPRRRLPSWYGSLPTGLFFDEAPHLLYLTASLLGDAQVVMATADHAEPGAEQPVRSMHTVLRSPVAPATLTMCFDAPLSEWHLMVVCERKVLAADLFRDISVVLGSDGSHGALDILRTSASAGAQHLGGFAGSGMRLVGGKQDWGHAALIGKFIDAVQQGGPSPVPVTDALKVVSLTDAILDAAA